MKRNNAQSGFSMIEMMVSLFILAIGLLGQMALQMTSVSSNRSSYYRSQAAIIANDFADRMRLNEASIKLQTGAITNYDNISVTPSSSFTLPSCVATGCSPSDLAKLDIYELQQALSASIPSGTATVVKDPLITDYPVYNLTITWTTEDRQGLTNGANVNKFEMGFGI